jgi:hypothetical protein
MVAVACGLKALKRERDVADATVLRISHDPESQLPAHFQHDRILVQNLAGYLFQAF